MLRFNKRVPACALAYGQVPQCIFVHTNSLGQQRRSAHANTHAHTHTHIRTRANTRQGCAHLHFLQFWCWVEVQSLHRIAPVPFCFQPKQLNCAAACGPERLPRGKVSTFACTLRPAHLFTWSAVRDAHNAVTHNPDARSEQARVHQLPNPGVAPLVQRHHDPGQQCKRCGVVADGPWEPRFVCVVILFYFVLFCLV